PWQEAPASRGEGIGMDWRVKAEILDASTMRRALVRVAHEVLERGREGEELALVGVRTRGVPLARRLASYIQEIEGLACPVGELDITLYRDDLSRIAQAPVVHQ